jgi:hypothetical protein
MKGSKFVLNSKNDGNIGKYATRHYFGIDAQVGIITSTGLTQLRGEYIWGNHSGNADGAYDFKFAAVPTGVVYMRKIMGGYLILTQDLGKIPFTAVLKYDWYNPNTEVSGNNITGKGEITMQTIGAGVLWRINAALRLTGYFDFVSNETSSALAGYESNRKDNVFTLRLQYKF